MGLRWSYAHPSEIMDEIARLTPRFAGVSYAVLDKEGSVQWPCNEEHPRGEPIMHVDGSARGKKNSASLNMCQATKGQARASRFFSPLAGYCRNIMSAHRRDARKTAAGTKRTSWKVIPMTPKTAA